MSLKGSSGDTYQIPGGFTHGKDRPWDNRQCLSPKVNPSPSHKAQRRDLTGKQSNGHLELPGRQECRTPLVHGQLHPILEEPALGWAGHLRT